jgi:predicted CXXCH cytochrome family protein
VTTDACAGCHRAHTAQGAKLLKAEEGALCLTCHNGSGATTKPFEGLTTGGLALRAGGFNAAYIKTTDDSWSRHTDGCAAGTDAHEYGTGSSNTPTAPSCVARTTAEKNALLHISPDTTLDPTTTAAVSSKHILDVADKTVWGGVGTMKLSCTVCHDPHGNGQYRILRPNPATEGGGTDKVAAVTVTDEVTKVYSTTNYMDVAYGGTTANDTGTSGISAWCSQCHQKYLANTGAWGGPGYESGSGDAVYKYKHATTSYAPKCITCHAAHGTNAKIYGGSGPSGQNYVAGQEWPSGSDLGGTRLLKMDNRGICQKCHKR